MEAQLVLAHAEQAAARLAADGTLPIDHIARTLSLSQLDEDILLAAVALEVDASFAISVSAIAGAEPRWGISSKLLAQLFGTVTDEVTKLRLDGAHPLIAVGLLQSTQHDLADTLRPWRAPARVVSFLAGDETPDAALARCGGLVHLPVAPDLEHVDTQLALVDRLLVSTDDDFIVLIEGPEGGGRRLLAAVAAQRNGRSAVHFDLGAASASPIAFTAALDAFTRECWLRRAVPIFARIEALFRDGRADERMVIVLDSIKTTRGPVVVTMLDGTAPPDFDRRVIRTRITAPNAAARLRLWRAALGTHANAPEFSTELASLAERYAMTPSLLHRAAANARQLARGRDVGVDDVQLGISSVIQERFGGLASHVEVLQKWDDLVLPQDTLDDVKAFVSRASNASMVYEQWGFRDKLQRGLGLAALFAGPPGTGKTMVAGLIAKALGLELYQVDLSQGVSKWVGETEKQIGKIFDAASMGQALLLFDEADALFARRTEVKSSNDRYANLEVNYLLQRLEQFAGVAILTPNLDGSVDPAFKRRLAAEVRFYAPELTERERLWRTILPSQTPVQGQLDFAELADEFPEMAGGHIRNAVLRAAFLAAAENQAVSQAHLLRAGRTESRNMGKIL